MSGFVEKVKDKVQQATHSGPYKEGDATHTGTHAAGTTGTHTTGTHTTGTHTTGTHTTGTGIGSTSTNAGPHDSNLANKLDPRVDSDLDGSRTAGTGTGAGLTGTTGTHHTGTGLTGTTGTHSTGTGLTGTHSTGTGLTGTTGTHSTSTAGPHSSNIANKLDPRVDSDRDGSNTLGSGTTGAGYGTTTGAGYGSTAGTGLGGHSGLGSTGAGYGSATGPATGTAGPHSSNLLNKADPRVDSDLDGSRTAGTAGGVGGAGLTGTHNTGVGHSGVGHSGVGGTTGTGFGNTGPGPAPNTAGPHSSDLLNKADPRVDSDLDGSKTVGGNATYHPQLPATDASDPSFAKSIDAAFRNDSVQKPTHAQVDGTVDNMFREPSRELSPPDAAKHTPEKFKKKLLRQGSITEQDLEDHEEYRREHLAGNEIKETLDKYGSGTQ